MRLTSQDRERLERLILVLMITANEPLAVDELLEIAKRASRQALRVKRGIPEYMIRKCVMRLLYKRDLLLMPDRKISLRKAR